jgi:hypothetical protein
MLNIKETIVRQLLGVATFGICAVLIFLGLVLAGFGIMSRRKVLIK